MEKTDGTQEQARRRGDSTAEPDDNANCNPTPGRLSEGDGDGQQINVDHENRPRRNSNSLKFIAGGILLQLIRSVQNQLEDADACIDWYSRKKKDYEAQLGVLNSLAELIKESEEASTVQNEIE
jgi:hypothetical protein